MSSAGTDYQEYAYHNTAECCTATYLLPEIFALAGEIGSQTRVLDVGCGNGFIAGQFAKRGCQVVGIDLSQSGIALARQAYPQARFEVLAADAEVLHHLAEAPFDLVISTEVVEHLYDPRSYAAGCFAALSGGGDLSAPRHITAMPRIWCWRWPASGIRTPIRCGTADISSCGAGVLCRVC